MPADDGKVLKMRFLMQIKTRPPTFFLFLNNKRLISNTFEQFLRNQIGKEFGFVGVPIRILLRDSRTQFAKKKLSQLSFSTRTVLSRIRAYKQKMRSVVFRRRRAGSKFLYRD